MKTMTSTNHNKIIRIPAYLTNFSTKVDRTAGIRISTNELSDEDFLLLKRHQGDFGWFVFVPNEEQEFEMPMEDAEAFDKSPSKRLRATLFVLWKQGKQESTFRQFYDEKMNQLIDMIKLKLK